MPGRSEKNEGWIVLIGRNLPEQPVHLKWALHLLLISVYQRSLAVPVLLSSCLQPCAVNGYAAGPAAERASACYEAGLPVSLAFNHPAPEVSKINPRNCSHPASNVKASGSATR